MRQYLIACTLACCSGIGQAATTELPPAVAQAARRAMSACQEYMHEDADEYRSCIDAVARAMPRGQDDTEARLLGHYYYAWVGANNSARLSLPGAEHAAQVYLGKFRVLQRRLKVDDKALCKAVPGDCVQRVAIIEQMGAEMRAGVRRR
ncbi:hypothetical protein BJN34_27370 [Cupriavidus necator]|uniref:Lysozyme inhibitor LprI N-terminal domain-containing protein n=1 Tax=Cupriavidus necator TaxID=106590 RepID=A0A1U9UY07_CUPNE|nr:hypothetical protein [Cupriavidus necator]AQV97586.1 hypothetical protein BJN34_27370 [Cupriavidus necator]